ncbi:ABC-F family ATP-binding cassette domain-containing protein [Longirhabdus pacifica]|uniref:ABC-F family ATP-binding cassette domain-containing protein n=1 Tax=Longirhabdus pacifica TaxID=2305227 RepID=UPI001008AE68|nr:ABC-F family ATP-binding cassette domain-containing protein [Longirhabdus pacifica]
MLLQASNIHKSFGANAILSNIHLQVIPQQKIGLVGMNGAGKSTLLKILAGELTPSKGDIHKAKDVHIGYLKQSNIFNEDECIWDELTKPFATLLNMEKELRQLEQQISIMHTDTSSTTDNEHPLLKKYDALAEQFRSQGGYEIETKIRTILNGMGFAQIEPSTKVSTLSGGQKTRLSLCKLLLEEPTLLLLDEPTNHLDMPTLTWLETYLKHYKGAIIIVSHDRYFLDAVVDTTYEIERTEAIKYAGNYSFFLAEKQKNRQLQKKRFDQQQKEIQQMEEFVQKNIVRASTTKRAKSKRKALESMDVVDQPSAELKKAKFSFEQDKMSGKEVLHVDNLTLAYDEHSEPLMEHLNLHVRRGERIAIIGPNGIGKSTFIKTLTGKHETKQGLIKWGTNVTIGYYDQEQANLVGNHTILEEVWREYTELDELMIRTVLGHFLFSGEEVTKEIRDLSGGEKARVSLAKLMLKKANVLVLDEPTNHLDIFSKEVLEAALQHYEGTLLFISHDRYFMNRLCEKIIECSAHGFQHFLGNYDDYVEKKQEIEELKSTQSLENVKKTNVEDKNHYEQRKTEKQQERKKQRKIEQLEQSIAEIEDEISQLEQLLIDEQVLSDYEQLHEKTKEIEAKKENLNTLYEEWEQLQD